MLFVVRHAKAGHRTRWEGPDDLRPLTRAGRRQAEALVDLLGDELAGRPLDRVLSSPSLRCRQTVEPLARKLGLAVEEAPALAEGSDVHAVLALVRSSAAATIVACTHGDVVPLLLEALAEVDGLPLPADYPMKKGSTWVLEERRRRFVTARYLPPPD